MILVDTNVILYAAGVEHAFKGPSVAFLERAVRGEPKTKAPRKARG